MVIQNNKRVAQLFFGLFLVIFHSPTIASFDEVATHPDAPEFDTFP